MVSDKVLLIAIYFSLITAGLTLLLLLLIALLRLKFHVEGKRFKDFENQWQPRLVRVIVGEAIAPAARLGRSGQLILLRLWNYWNESMAGESRARLRQFVREIGCEQVAMKLARKGNRAQKLLSVISLGNFGHAPAWKTLRDLVDRPDQILALHAARAMLQIDPELAMSELLPRILQRQEWELSVIANIVKSSRSAFEKTLQDAWPRLDTPARVRALQLCQHLTLPLPDTLVEPLLQPSTDFEQLMAALQLVARLQTPRYRSRVLALLDHPHGLVRAQAVQTLGATATRQDTALLLEMLVDRDLLVRHTAAKSLMQLPAYGSERLRHFNEALCDARVHQAVTMAMLDHGVPG